MKVKVAISKTYYKSSTIDIEVPDNIKEDDIIDYLYELDYRTSKLTSELADASLHAAGDMEVEAFEIISE